jgi:polyvinyl alcohol dehydrogenase (cytochrome)
VVFSGAQDGRVRGYSARDGRVIWEFNTAREFETVNGVKARGGALNGSGPTIVGGLMFVGSGYNNPAGNVLLAFGVE